jgi:hypothetical protein
MTEVLDRMTMQVFVRRDCSMIAAPVQCDVDGVPEASHFARVPASTPPETADKVPMLVGIGGNPSNVLSSARSGGLLRADRRRYDAPEKIRS